MSFNKMSLASRLLYSHLSMHWNYRQVTQSMAPIKRYNFKENRKQEFEWQGFFFPNLTNVMLHCSLSLMSVKKKLNLTYLITFKKNVLIVIHNYLQLLYVYTCTWMQVSAVARGIRSPLHWNYSQMCVPE